MADDQQTQQMILFTCEISLCQHVCELVFGVNIFDLDLGVQIDSVKTTNQEQLCRVTGNMSHGRASSFYDHLGSLLRCLKTHTTKLPDEKNVRLRK